jgi:hypothetical protein
MNSVEPHHFGQRKYETTGDFLANQQESDHRKREEPVSSALSPTNDSWSLLVHPLRWPHTVIVASVAWPSRSSTTDSSTFLTPTPKAPRPCRQPMTGPRSPQASRRTAPATTSDRGHPLGSHRVGRPEGASVYLPQNPTPHRTRCDESRGRGCPEAERIVLRNALGTPGHTLSLSALSGRPAARKTTLSPLLPASQTSSLWGLVGETHRHPPRSSVGLPETLAKVVAPAFGEYC